MGKRRSNPTLTGSRIYIRKRRYCLFSRVPIQNPTTGKVAKWHSLCTVDKGELAARNEAERIRQHNRAPDASGNLPGHMAEYLRVTLERRTKNRPLEAARAKMHDDGSKEIARLCGVISKAFHRFDVAQVHPVDVAKFVDQWAGQRTAEVYLSRCTDFFRWCKRNGLRADNPAEGIGVEKPPKRKRYLTDEEWHDIRDAMLTGKDGRATSSGPMIQCYVDLCYLLYQRTTEIRLLKWSQIDLQAGVIRFKPTKTERSSGLSVAVPITQPTREVLERARKVGTIKGLYVIHNRQGQPYTSRGIGDAWERACERAGVVDAITKDIRAKAATDAKRKGYNREQIRVALAHTDANMTDDYLRGMEPELSTVELGLPSKPQKARDV